jgi:flavin-dependent dehydrogenase
LLQRAWSRLSTQSMRESEGGHNSYDVLILGGGPAGAATGIALKRLDSGLHIALIEKSDYSSFRIGETLPPHAQAVLRGLGVWDAFIATSPMMSYGTRAAWGNAEPYENEFIFSLHGNGWHLDRNAFDAMLTAEAIKAGVDVQVNSAPCGPPRRHQHWALPVRIKGAICELNARFIVDATGRHSWFASRLGVRYQVYDQLAAIFAFYRFDPGSIAVDNCTLIEATQHGWWYSAMLPQSRMAVAFMADAPYLRQISWRSLEKWRSLHGATSHTRRRIENAIPLGSPTLCSAASRRLEIPVGEDWLAVGDAASTFDPLSSQGIIKGLHSGVCAARSICRYVRGHKGALAEYANFIERQYSNYLAARSAYYRVEQRWPDSPFWQQRQKTLQLDPEHELQMPATGDVSSDASPARGLSKLSTSAGTDHSSWVSSHKT